MSKDEKLLELFRKADTFKVNGEICTDFLIHDDETISTPKCNYLIQIGYDDGDVYITKEMFRSAIIDRDTVIVDQDEQGITIKPLFTKSIRKCMLDDA